jgi:hypothetical protein
LEQSGIGVLVEATAVRRREPIQRRLKIWFSTNTVIKEEKAMAQPQKQNTTKVICAKIKDTESVEDLSEVIRIARLRMAGFEIAPDAFDDIKREDLVVLEALVVHLRKIIEADERLREHRRLKLEEEDDD